MNTARFFDDYYNNAEVNALIVMDCDGTIRNVNNSFTNNFGYNNEEIAGRNFDILFTGADNEQNKPKLELEMVISNGQANDENYLVNKAGYAIWCTGEALLVTGEKGEKYIVKDIVNLQAKKHLQVFLRETEDLLERVFESSKDIPMMILDGSMKIQKVNTAFLDLFEIQDPPSDGSSISDLDHPFWNREDIKKELRKIIVNNEPIRSKEFLLQTKPGQRKTIRLDSKIIDGSSTVEKKIFIIMEETNAK
jgi:PAS domain S-box-containing protein